jgi:hypothetical protein
LPALCRPIKNWLIFRIQKSQKFMIQALLVWTLRCTLILIQFKNRVGTRNTLYTLNNSGQSQLFQVWNLKFSLVYDRVCNHSQVSLKVRLIRSLKDRKTVMTNIQMMLFPKTFTTNWDPIPKPTSLKMFGHTKIPGLSRPSKSRLFHQDPCKI